jgi:hypothetical protein
MKEKRVMSESPEALTKAWMGRVDGARKPSPLLDALDIEPCPGGFWEPIYTIRQRWDTQLWEAGCSVCKRPAISHRKGQDDREKEKVVSVEKRVGRSFKRLVVIALAIPSLLVWAVGWVLIGDLAPDPLSALLDWAEK